MATYIEVNEANKLRQQNVKYIYGNQTGRFGESLRYRGAGVNYVRKTDY